jgi:hypothetical protein
MHARELVELAAFVATHGAARIRCRQRFPEHGLQEYWSAAKCRLDRWARDIKAYATAGCAAGRSHRRWESIQPVAEEIVSSEILTRVWTAIGCGCDQACGADDTAPVLLNVWAAHQEARQRVLRLIVAGCGLEVEQAMSLNRSRRICERWTDLLLSRLTEVCSAGRFGFSARRVHEFADELRHSQDPDLAWAVSRASLCASFQWGWASAAPNPDLNRRLAAAILACFTTESFDALGLPKSLWLVRVEQLADDAQCLVEDLLSPEDPALLTGEQLLLRRRRR